MQTPKGLQVLLSRQHTRSGVACIKALHLECFSFSEGLKVLLTDRTRSCKEDDGEGHGETPMNSATAHHYMPEGQCNA